MDSNNIDKDGGKLVTGEATLMLLILHSVADASSIRGFVHLMKYRFMRRDLGDAGSLSSDIISHLWSDWTSQWVRWSRDKASLYWYPYVCGNLSLTAVFWGL